ncbi:MAG: RNA-binding protein [Deltaproteobacteria bacterium]|nr:MAG: RNA-binding protein [Deltaproteobacteria bacterium]
MAKIHITNLSSHLSEGDLRGLFEKWGTVLSVELVVDPKTGKGRGYGFLEMDDMEAKAAATALDGINFGGQTLRVTPLIGC